MTANNMWRASPRIRFPYQGAASFTVFTDYFTEGVRHILTGFDHILFLLTLLLPAVLILKTDQWKPVESARPAILSAVGSVTVFTLAHSITLSLAVLDPVSRPIEFLIAFPVLIATLNKLLRRICFYQFWKFRGGSIAAALIASVWMVERAVSQGACTFLRIIASAPLSVLPCLLEAEASLVEVV